MPSSPKVHFYHPVDETGASYERLRAAGIEVKLPEGAGNVDGQRLDVADMLFDPDTVIGVGIGATTMGTMISAKTFDSAPDLRMIANFTVGYDNVDVDEATKRGILVIHSPTENNWGGVAEGAMAMLLTVMKRTRERDRHVKAGGWRESSLLGTYLGARQIDNFDGLAIGLVGFGRIARRFADLLAPWRVRLMACDPYVEDAAFAHHNVKQVDLETLLMESDVVSLHCNLTDETRGMIGAPQIALMKNSAMLLNTARGPIVDVDALYDALSKDRLAVAALDVLPLEPPDPQMPLMGLGDKILLSPHMVAGNKGTGLELAVPVVNQAIMAVLRGEVPKFVVNRDVIPAWRERFGDKRLI
ncbi:MAG TPA: NAD(P)-dependent oxidoreductase [Alphaproteobacteria bacterium]|nr:NAD(P)-dependent oxidoreductase [Alphaproteobacteria bacterium]